MSNINVISGKLNNQYSQRLSNEIKRSLAEIGKGVKSGSRVEKLISNKKYLRTLIGSYDTPLTPEIPGVYLMIIESGGNYYYHCSSTLSAVHEDYSVFTTAAHCVDPNDNYVRYIFDLNTFTIKGRLYCGINSKFNVSATGTALLEEVQYDYTSCVVSEIIDQKPIVPCQFDNTNITKFGEYDTWISGFGMTGSDGKCDEASYIGRRSESFKLKNKVINVYNNAFFLFLNGGSNFKTYSCPADSGSSGLVTNQTNLDGYCQLSIVSGGGSSDGTLIYMFQAPLNNQVQIDLESLTQEALIRMELNLNDYQGLPTSYPTLSLNPSTVPSASPSKSPSADPSTKPSTGPSIAPSADPSKSPSADPSREPSASPSKSPSADPSTKPSTGPSIAPSVDPSKSPSAGPSTKPSTGPSIAPSVDPSKSPSADPSTKPSTGPSIAPSASQSKSPSVDPSTQPSTGPSIAPSASPSKSSSAGPSKSPSTNPSKSPIADPSKLPSTGPSTLSSWGPSILPSESPSMSRSIKPTLWGGVEPTLLGSVEPTLLGTVEPSSPKSAATPSSASLDVKALYTIVGGGLLLLGGVVACVIKKRFQNCLQAKRQPNSTQELSRSNDDRTPVESSGIIVEVNSSEGTLG